MPQTILLTGASGFIAKHIALDLLNAGHQVRATVRSLSRGAEVTAAVRPHLTDPAGLQERLTFVALDLGDDAGWNAAARGVTAVMHTASPFPLVQPKDPADLIRPAVDGTLRVLRAAQTGGVTRVILTSSVVAIMGGPLPPGKVAYDETDWTPTDDPAVSAYGLSKTLAERAAWDFVRDHTPGMQLTTINPGLVTGPPLDVHFGTSVGVVQRVLRGKDPLLPHLGFTLVDVRDVALMHLRALERPETAGKRYIGATESLWFTEIGAALKAAHPSRRIPTRQSPDILIRLLGLFDPSVRAIVPSLGKIDRADNTAARRDLGIDFIPAPQSLAATADFLIEHAAV